MAYAWFCRGCAAVSSKKELVVIDNAINGFTLYPLDSSEVIRTFFTNPPSVPVPKQVAFGEESKVIIGGSDNGVVYIFLRGDQVNSLRKSLMQQQAWFKPSVQDIGSHCIIASASPAQGRRKALVRVWSHPYEAVKNPKHGGDQSLVKGILKLLTTLVAFIIFVAVANCLQKNTVSQTVKHGSEHIPSS
ncbi:hypothetical protein J3R83DRAFT_3992 [Lanmaoa asiatica]|nr:hypothetical protein J3R83DRAFT_3992 [Lanmaoa asiatica]